MPLRIMVIGQLPPPVHGSNVMTKRFMEALAANGVTAKIVEKTFSKQLHEVGRKSLIKGLKVPGLCRRVNKAVVGYRPDFCVYFISVGLSSLLVDCLILHQLKKKNIPYILYFHGVGYRRHEKNANPVFKSIIRSVLTNALGGLVLGEALKFDVAHCIPRERLYVLPNGIPSVAGVEKKNENRTDHVHIIFLSNLIPAKGSMRFLNMAQKIHEQQPQVKYTLAGRHVSEKYLNELKDFVNNKGLEDSVSIPGPLYGDEKNKLFNDADILIFPTSFEKEASPIVNIEAMMWGLPVISSPMGAIPEIVRDGINGYIVDPENISLLAERVLKLVRDHDLRLKMGAAGEKLFRKHYSLKAYKRNLKSALEFFGQLSQEDGSQAP